MRALDKVLVLATTILMLGCVHCSDTATGPVPPPDTPQCGAACDKMAKMGCEEGMPVPVPPESDDCILHGTKGTDDAGQETCTVTCQYFCTSIQGTYVWLNPSCILQKVESCDQIEPLCAPKR